MTDLNDYEKADIVLSHIPEWNFEGLLYTTEDRSDKNFLFTKYLGLVEREATYAQLSISDECFEKPLEEWEHIILEAAEQAIDVEKSENDLLKELAEIIDNAGEES